MARFKDYLNERKNREIDQIIEAIKKTVEPLMDKWEVDFFNFIKKAQQYVTQDVFKEPKYKNASWKERPYIKLELAQRKGYGKSLQRYFGRSASDLRKMVKKEANNKLEKIDFAVNKKLRGVKIYKIERLYFDANSKDGFVNGAWKINDDKIFSFESIYAGGWNIQVEHVRTLYKYK